MRRVLAVAIPVLASTFACQKEPPKPDVPQLVAQLRSPDAERSGQANLELLKDPDPAIRERGGRALWGLGSRAKAAVGQLAEALADPEAPVRRTAAMALEALGRDAAVAVPALTRAVHDDDAITKQWAMKALGKIGPAASPAAPAITEEARRHPELRPTAEEALKLIGP